MVNQFKQPKTWMLVLGLGVFVVVYQAILLYLWATFPQWDWILLRYSLSNSDAVCIYSTFVAFLAYFLYEKSGESEAMQALKEFAQLIRPVIKNFKAKYPNPEDQEKFGVWMWKKLEEQYENDWEIDEKKIDEIDEEGAACIAAAGPRVTEVK